jgi:hypothetical protein
MGEGEGGGRERVGSGGGRVVEFIRQTARYGQRLRR